MILNNLKKRFLTSFALLLLIFVILSFNIFLVYSLIVFGVLAMLEFYNIAKKIFKNKIYLSISNSFFTIYIFIFCILFFFFSNIIQLKIILFSLLIGCVASDIGGFIFGRIIKGPKLSKISPNKTIAGAFGSLIMTNIIFSCSIFYFTKHFSYTILIIATITSISCQFGDLFFSYLKRKAIIKDTGNILPGHGGVLDRLDGILVGIPLGFITLTLIY
tara:strand:- start:72 stop:722 length:651 start_codon:yes stop_codon:yes gene_type:complete